MVKLTEEDIQKAYIGKTYNEKRYLELATLGAFHPADCDIKAQVKLELYYKINITSSLTWDWKQRDIDFRINTYFEDGRVVGCSINKRKNNYCGLYTRKPCVYLKPTQQELRLFRRVMEYITTFDEE